MRMLDCLADFAEQLQSRVERQGVLPGIRRQRQPVDILHRDPWRAVGQRAGIVEVRDARMVQLRERALLAGKSIAPRR